MNHLAIPRWQFHDTITGNPLAGGKLYTYAAGTDDPLVTYKDEAGETENDNPIILDSRGEAQVWCTDAQYKFVLADMWDSVIWTEDNHHGVSKIPDPLILGDIQAPMLTRTVDTIADLRDMVGTASIKTVKVLGYYAVGDGGGGPLRRYVTGAELDFYVDNGGSIIVPTDGDGSEAWLWDKDPGDNFNARWFGAKADGATDDTEAIQAAIDACGGAIGTIRKRVYLPTGQYQLSGDGLKLPEFFPGLYGDGIYSTQLFYSGTGVALTSSTYLHGTGNYNDFYLKAGVPGDTVEEQRAVERNGIWWHCYGGPANISNILVQGFNGFGHKFTAIWDSVVTNTLTLDCGNDTEWAYIVEGGLDLSNHTIFNRIQVEVSHSKAINISGLRLIINEIHSERTVSDGESPTHILAGDITVIDGRNEADTVYTQIGITTGSITNYTFAGKTEFLSFNRLAGRPMLENCTFGGGQVTILYESLNSFIFQGCRFFGDGDAATVEVQCAEESTVFDSCHFVCDLTCTPGEVTTILRNSVTEGAITSLAGNNTIIISGSTLTKYPNVGYCTVADSTVLNAVTTAYAQKNTVNGVTFKSTVSLFTDDSLWISDNCIYEAGTAYAGGTVGWLFGPGNRITGGTSVCGNTPPGASTGVTYNIGNRTYNQTPTQYSTKSWVYTVDGWVAEGIVYATEPPTTGAHKVGERVVNPSPTPFGPRSWVCLAEGTPGLWEQEGDLYTLDAPSTGIWRAGTRCWNYMPSVGQPKSWVCTETGAPGTWVSEGDL